MRMDDQAIEDDTLIDTVAAAAVLGISPVTLGIWRCQRERDQPAFVRVGRRAVRYSRAELARWIDSRRNDPKTAPASDCRPGP
jgi:predicted DNA-binding transcriptional regulator AlpA